jgi:hypothetical protein
LQYNAKNRLKLRFFLFVFQRRGRDYLRSTPVIAGGRLRPKRFPFASLLYLLQTKCPAVGGDIFSIRGEGGERTLWLSAIIFNALGSTDWLGAPNFPPHDLGEFGGTKIPRFCDFYHYSKQKD